MGPEEPDKTLAYLVQWAHEDPKSRRVAVDYAPNSRTHWLVTLWADSIHGPFDGDAPLLIDAAASALQKFQDAAEGQRIRS